MRDPNEIVPPIETAERGPPLSPEVVKQYEIIPFEKGLANPRSRERAHEAEWKDNTPDASNNVDLKATLEGPNGIFWKLTIYIPRHWRWYLAGAGAVAAIGYFIKMAGPSIVQLLQSPATHGAL
jgi:hypothetical protein